MSGTPKQPDLAATESWGPYNVPQQRMDAWNDFQVRSSWLNEFAGSSQDISEPKGLVQASLNDLRDFETYWAFPGPARVAALAQLLDRGAYADLAIEARELARQLVGDAYRLREPKGPAQALRRREQ